MIKQTKLALQTDAARTRQLIHAFEAVLTEFEVREDFPQAVLEEVERVTSQAMLAELTSDPTRLDLTHLEFVTLDPASSTDLDQAFCIEAPNGPDAPLLLHYAIADVGAFVARGSALEAEAWKRGETVYAPHRRIPLYPPVLCEGAGSLLPGSPKPAVELRVEQAVDGTVTFQGARRCVIQSRAKLAYELVAPSGVPFLSTFAARSEAAEARRGAVRSDLPEQEIRETDAGHFVLELRQLLESETANAALSLGANLAAGDFLADQGVGLFRVMEMPDDESVRSLRRLAVALQLDWPAGMSLGSFQRSLPIDDARNRSFLVSARRAGGGASYATLGCDANTDAPGRPHHAAIAGTYLHATAPLRRLADRYVLDLLCEYTAALDAGMPFSPTPEVRQTLAGLPEVMRRSAGTTSRIERAAIDVTECVLLEEMVGKQFSATVLESADNGAVIQIAVPPVRARLSRSAVARGAVGGAVVEVRLERVDIEARSLSFSLVGS